MSFDFTTILTDVEGKPLIAEGVSVTLGFAASNALLNTYQDETVSGVDKVKRFQLAMRVQKATDVELTTEDITLLKTMIAKLYGPLIVGQAWAILDPASVK